MARNITISDFYCTQCGNKGFVLPRKSNKQREPGHLKKIYCLTCRNTVNHAEVREIGGYTLEDFLEEFNGGNFDKEGNRIQTYKSFLNKVRMEMN